FPYHPNARGFDEFYGFCSGHWGNYFSPMLDHNGQMVTGNGFLPDDLTERAIEFIETHQESPFFVYLPYNTPHSPMQMPDEWWDRVKDRPLDQPHRYKEKEKPDFTRAALALCENIDWNVGRLLTKLDTLELADNTIVVYFSDNGPNGWRWNGDMRGKKGSTDEGGVRSPLFIRWPGKIAPGTRIAPISSAMDLLPTLTDLAGVPVREGKPLDGISLKPLLFGQGDSAVERTLIQSWRPKRISVRTQQYRLDHKNRLYDMLADPGQRTDVSAAHPDVAKELKQISNDWKKTQMAYDGQDDRPFVIGHPDSPFTQLPARDGAAHGNIRRSSRWPNSSFFTNWESLEDSITWDCEVGETGVYQVELFYTCPAADVGSTVELSFKDARLTGTISEPHDPPLTGMAYDRWPRMESYEKNFKRMTLGTIHLEKGAGTLKLQALDIPGSQVMDFRLLFLTRLDE
ncbi:MAG TPA: sulfatase-like hydrolase/transferase, partial [Tichowtungia sp.]|nr:sulfatase-like hydrolase/transferase [Tichowtungia sp.]